MSNFDVKFFLDFTSIQQKHRRSPYDCEDSDEIVEGLTREKELLNGEVCFEFNKQFWKN